MLTRRCSDAQARSVAARIAVAFLTPSRAARSSRRRSRSLPMRVQAGTEPPRRAGRPRRLRRRHGGPKARHLLSGRFGRHLSGHTLKVGLAVDPPIDVDRSARELRASNRALDPFDLALRAARDSVLGLAPCRTTVFATRSVFDLANGAGGFRSVISIIRLHGLPFSTRRKRGRNAERSFMASNTRTSPSSRTCTINSSGRPFMS